MHIARLVALALISSACAPPEPVDFATHTHSLLVARASARLLPVERVASIDPALARVATPIAHFHVGHGLLAAGAATHFAMVSFLATPAERPALLPGHTFGPRPPAILGTADSTFVWAVNPASGRLFVEDVGDNQRARGRLHVRDSLRSACLSSSGFAYFLDDAFPSAIRQQPFSDSALDIEPKSIALPEYLRDDFGNLSLRGSMSTRCAVFSSRGDSFQVIDAATGELAAHEFVESSRVVRQGESLLQSWIRSARERRHPRTTAIDIAVDQQLIAVLFAGRSSDAARLVDFYHPEHGYIGSLRLPVRAERVALAYNRLYALARDTERAYLVSFVLPVKYRSTAPDSIVPTGLEGRVPELLRSSLDGQPE